MQSVEWLHQLKLTSFVVFAEGKAQRMQRECTPPVEEETKVKGISHDLSLYDNGGIAVYADTTVT
jgi:hypothetical protein